MIVVIIGAREVVIEVERSVLITVIYREWLENTKNSSSAGKNTLRWQEVHSDWNMLFICHLRTKFCLHGPHPGGRIEPRGGWWQDLSVLQWDRSGIWFIHQGGRVSGGSCLQGKLSWSHFYMLNRCQGTLQYFLSIPHMTSTQFFYAGRLGWAEDVAKEMDIISKSEAWLSRSKH